MKKLFYISIFIFSTIAVCCQTAEDYFEKGRSNANLGSYRAAIADFTKAIELDPQMAKAYNYRASVKEATGDWTGAIEDYTQAIELIPDYSLAYLNRGLLHVTIGNNEKACADLEKASSLGNSRASRSRGEYCK